MSIELLSALASVGTFLVIGTTAIAAIIQLRHMRGSNQIIALTECRETLESERFRRAFQFVAHELQQVVGDPDARMRLLVYPTPPDLEAMDIVGNFFESMGSFVRFGIIDRTIACDLWTNIILKAWGLMEPAVSICRVDTPELWTNFEYLATLAQDRLQQGEFYPPGARRMKIDEKSLAIADEVERRRRE